MKVKRITGGYTFPCPGCNEDHEISDVWTFNGDIDSPTFSPSLLRKTGHYVDQRVHDHPCWCDYDKERIEAGKEPSGFKCQICHSFIKDGKIEFLSDCTHEMAGQTVEMLNDSSDFRQYLQSVMNPGR